MARSKYIIAFFLFLAVFLFTGESYTYFLENFQNSYTQVGYFLPAGESERKMNRYILQMADDFGASVFALEKSDEGAFKRTITIYCNDVVKEILKQDWNIKQGNVSSFFSGTTTFIFKPFDKATEKILQNCWYPDKSPDELYDMVYPGMTRYSGAFRNEPVPAASKKAVAGVWSVLLIAILLLTAYDISYGRKEQAVRIILGADNGILTQRKALSDICGLSVSALFSFLILVPFTTPAFELSVSSICFLVVLAVNTIFIIGGMNPKKSPPLKMLLSKKILGFSMGLKGLTAVFTIIVLSAAFGLSVEGIKLYSQKDYYAAQDNSVHADISYPYDYEKTEIFTGSTNGRTPLNTKEQLQDNFLRYSYKNLGCSLLYSHSYKDIAPKYGDKYVFANLRGLNSYKAYIPNWKELCGSEGNYILFPEKYDREDVITEFFSFANIIGISEDSIKGTAAYKDGLSVIAESRRNSEFDYSYRINDPIIILDTYDYGKLPLYEITYSLRKSEKTKGIIYNNAAFLIQFISVRNDPRLLRDFAGICGSNVIDPDLIEFSVENVEDWFNGLWALQNRSLLIIVILAFLLLVLEIQITALVLRIAYEARAKELTVKKVLGYSMAERYRSFFILSGVICSLALIGALAEFIFLKIGAVQYMVYGSLTVLLIDWLILTVLTRKNDRLEIQRVLKGGI